LIRILHVDSEKPWRGGQRQVLLLMRRQRARGDEPHLAAPGKSALLDRASREGFSVHPVPMHGTWDLGSVLALAGLMGSIRPEIVHWHAARAHAVGAMAALLRPEPRRVLSRRVVFPVRRSLGSKLLYAIPLDRIVAISEAVRQALIRSGVRADRIDVVPSGIDPAPEVDSGRLAELRRSLGCADGDVVGISVAALSPGKGHSDLLRAAAIAVPRAPRLRLWIVGEGPLERSLREERRSRGLEGAVSFLGFRTDVEALLQAADFFCIATHAEGLGSSILEAMAAGLPVVATRVGGVPEVVDDGHTGVLVPPSDPSALSESLIEIATRADLRETMGVRARERAKRFLADATAQGTYDAYRSAMEAGRERT
jgi:glycosyltransferase involved in cell wall biosynthesis